MVFDFNQIELIAFSGSISLKKASDEKRTDCRRVLLREITS